MSMVRELTSRLVGSGRRRRPLRVGVIGAGAAGITMGVALRRLGIADFTIFEQSDGFGGTWHDNIYPGAEVDTPVPFYSYSYHPFSFTRTHVRQAELLAYLQNVADRFALRPNCSFENGVSKVVWDESRHVYELETVKGESHTFDVVVSAVGLLNHPRYPDWPGMRDFQGPMFHTSRWDHGVDLTGKRVAVVGTGSTAAQVVPAIAPTVEKIYLFQRQPGWILPKNSRVFTPEERARLEHPVHRRVLRVRQRLSFERIAKYLIEGTPSNVATQQQCLDYIGRVFKDRPDLQKKVTPNYPFGGKRTIRDDHFYPSLLRENIELVPHAVERLTRTGVVDAIGEEYDVDVVVLSTGFQPANFLATYEVVGRDGRSIHDFWGPDARAFLGLTVAGFPNFYMMYGPNTNGGPQMFLLERQAAFVVANLKRMMRSGLTAIEVRKGVMDTFNEVLQRRLRGNVSARHPEVHNYGRTSTGRDVIAWTDGMAVYSFLTRISPRLSSTARRLGSSTKDPR